MFNKQPQINIVFDRRKQATSTKKSSVEIRGTTKSVDLGTKIQLKHPGTRYSKDFALFLKKADGR